MITCQPTYDLRMYVRTYGTSFFMLLCQCLCTCIYHQVADELVREMAETERASLSGAETVSELFL